MYLFDKVQELSCRCFKSENVSAKVAVDKVTVQTMKKILSFKSYKKVNEEDERDNLKLFKSYFDHEFIYPMLLGTMRQVHKNENR